MNIQQLEKKLSRYFQDKTTQSRVAEGVLDRIRAFSFNNSSLTDVKLYCIHLYVGGVKLLTTIRGNIVEDMLDKSYIFSRELICTSQWNFQRILCISFSDEEGLTVHVKTVTKKELYEVLFNVIKPTEITYTVVYTQEKRKHYGKVQVDIEYLGKLDYYEYLLYLVDAYHHNTKIVRGRDDLHCYEFYIVDFLE